MFFFSLESDVGKRLRSNRSGARFLCDGKACKNVYYVFLFGFGSSGRGLKLAMRLDFGPE